MPALCVRLCVCSVYAVLDCVFVCSVCALLTMTLDLFFVRPPGPVTNQKSLLSLYVGAGPKCVFVVVCSVYVLIDCVCVLCVCTLFRKR